MAALSRCLSSQLPDLLRRATMPDEISKGFKPRPQSVGNIVEWVQHFCSYIAIIHPSYIKTSPQELAYPSQGNQGSIFSKLLPDLLQRASMPDEISKSFKPRPQSVGNIVEWVQCFGSYIATCLHYVR